MSRPPKLPDFGAPPLNEVVLGVQFATPRGYQQILAHQVWDLFRAEFPSVQEQPPILPQFETFGLTQTGAQINLNLITGARHDRFWFVSPSGNELVQFQPDRLLHNWRQVGGEGIYPRFEKMFESFTSELDKLSTYFLKLSGEQISINQCEISYINHIVEGDGTKQPQPDDWLSYVHFGPNQPDDFNVGFRQVIKNAEGKPIGRLHCETAAAMNDRRQHLIQMTLTVRGVPAGSTVGAALDFLRMGREMVVTKFAELTTEKAHARWERKQ